VITKKLVNSIAYQVVGCAIEVHRNLGPGLLESVYQLCMIDELKEQGLNVQSQVYLPVIYKGKDIGGTLKIDLLVNDLVVVELKAVDIMISVYKA